MCVCVGGSYMYTYIVSKGSLVLPTESDYIRYPLDLYVSLHFCHRRCWDEEMHKRPSPTEIKRKLAKLCEVCPFLSATVLSAHAVVPPKEGRRCSPSITA